MNENDELSKKHHGRKHLLGDEIQYQDHIGEIIKRAEKEGAFDNLKGKGKPLDLDGDWTYNPERQLNKVLKDNNVLPPWIQLDKEIEKRKLELAEYKNEYNIRKSVEEINKKIFNYNLSCPPSTQKRMIKLEDYLPDSE
ncbi:DUF1992 domain-containing protein [Alkalihalobacillus sp. AL-G]|uniref:DnaJ family domain-containing protein n=1 Tax=Alkalihalobacillus sp. AL-G TaxID=2926399 RepID=UPI00272AA016|nr:DUF1992 domain-containing protein [Alkalihalobacillus sp. AL-G]WLD93213.1 DUF1992 domain-containing protein [Alkalihalobacillus sp. AL-G]